MGALLEATKYLHAQRSNRQRWQDVMFEAFARSAGVAAKGAQERKSLERQAELNREQTKYEDTLKQQAIQRRVGRLAEAEEKGLDPTNPWHMGRVYAGQDDPSKVGSAIKSSADADKAKAEADKIRRLTPLEEQLKEATIGKSRAETAKLGVETETMRTQLGPKLIQEQEKALQGRETTAQEIYKTEQERLKTIEKHIDLEYADILKQLEEDDQRIQNQNARNTDARAEVEQHHKFYLDQRSVDIKELKDMDIAAERALKNKLDPSVILFNRNQLAAAHGLPQKKMVQVPSATNPNVLEYRIVIDEEAMIQQKQDMQEEKIRMKKQLDTPAKVLDLLFGKSSEQNWRIRWYGRGQMRSVVAAVHDENFARLCDSLLEQKRQEWKKRHQAEAATQPLSPMEMMRGH